MADGYLQVVREKDYIEANRNLLRVDQRLTINDLNLSWSLDRVKRFANDKAATCSKIANSHYCDDHAYERCKALVEHYKLSAPQPKDHNGDTYPCIKRMCNPDWWRQKITKLQRKLIESIARDFGLVNQQKSPYSSKATQHQRAAQKSRNLQYLESTFIENDDGQRFCLKELHDRSVSNPAIRRAELMTRIKGFEMVAEQLKHVGEFYTITAPSRMHARLKKGIPNPKYDGTTPDQAHNYLRDTFVRIRSKLHRQGLTIYGVRVVEPNHDGTPHWHLLLFMDKGDQASIREIFREYSLKVDSDEAGAKKHRFKAVAIDPNKGSAAGYVAKYVAKNIDGEFISEDLQGNEAKATAAAIDAWASTYNIRQFQFIGGPSVTVWRELRRVAISHLSKLVDKFQEPSLYKAMKAADAAEWAAFVMVMGGIGIKASSRPIKPIYEKLDICHPETGEILSEHLTRFGDPKPPRVIGVMGLFKGVISRWRKWELVKEPPSPLSTSLLARSSALLGGEAPKALLDLCQ